MEMTSGQPDSTPPQTDSTLRRAASVLRDAPVHGWVDISAAALSRVRAVGVRTWPLDARYPDEGVDVDEDTLRVSDVVVRIAVRSAVAEVAGTEPADISLYTEGHRCTGGLVTVIAAYGTDLLKAGDLVASRAAAALTDVLGLPYSADDIGVVIAEIDAPDQAAPSTSPS
ncbi:hypothetical protein HQ325_17320 [Rhodococcus sp. BP-349]|uniref:hypothetical protein n=1 Tax=unclassified Rhodococcus (in: high G+C Gram-positive bacteria) TaxID=192944 RepID=UPI001C9B33D0|nr:MULTISPECIES: hypothetical protein [unclassified Rhodococcus (in: high G+C Gram-positive bacteria)]MBY6540436.1 hypothetical protein [Rhodococcus sp. BP-363]MBY6545539.1 hypothetical protein [Rhodococcus sp. BP-369]MBY6564769.1 hypothetical protein [Rhodococcus sp. BP-370]MBY6578295.1 hypothetical protein [Rhodococcus sp. BP-364]MBY6587596.1 hypothetical protein [Rhodococcus sp. BP-358]